jgi:hypothetical protein
MKAPLIKTDLRLVLAAFKRQIVTNIAALLALQPVIDRRIRQNRERQK